MTIHFAIERRCLSQGSKQWPLILQLSHVSPKDASNDHFLLFDYLSLPKIQSMTILQSSPLLRKDANNDYFAIERSLSKDVKNLQQSFLCSQGCEEFPIFASSSSSTSSPPLSVGVPDVVAAAVLSVMDYHVEEL